MKVEWTLHYSTEFPEEELERICNYFRHNQWNRIKAMDMIQEVVMGFDDDVYFAWDYSQSEMVYNEILRRIGGVQLSMFNDPFGVPEDYNEGWR